MTTSSPPTLTVNPSTHGQERRQVLGDEVDDVRFEGLAGGEVGGLQHRGFRPLNVAAAQFGQALDVGHRIVQHLAFHGRAGGRFGLGRGILALLGVVGRLFLILLSWRLRRGTGHRERRTTAAADAHRRRRTYVSGRRHGGDVAGVHDVGAGARRAGAVRRYVGGHGHFGCEDRFDHVAHGLVEAAGRVEAHTKRSMGCSPARSRERMK